MTTALATRSMVSPIGRQADTATLALAWQQAQGIYKSQMYKGISSPEHAAAIMIKGYEIGFNLTASLDYIKMVNGRPVLEGAGILALVQTCPIIDLKIVDIEDENGDPLACEVTMKRKDNGFSYTAKFTMKQALRAGLISKGGAWEAYPEDMLCWRAVARAAKRTIPDLLAGLSTRFELSVMDEEPADPVKMLESPLPGVDVDPRVTFDPVVAERHSATRTSSGQIVDGDTGEVVE